MKKNVAMVNLHPLRTGIRAVPGGFQAVGMLFGKRSFCGWIKKVRQAEHKTDIAMLAADTAKRDRVGLSRPPG